MLKLSISLDSIGYDKVIELFFPLIFKSKILLQSAQIMARAAIKNKTPSEQNEFVADFINKHKQKIQSYLQEHADSLGLSLQIRDIEAQIK